MMHLREGACMTKKGAVKALQISVECGGGKRVDWWVVSGACSDSTFPASVGLQWVVGSLPKVGRASRPYFWSHQWRNIAKVRERLEYNLRRNSAMSSPGE
eukprot:59132-Amphidinium_carterae.1